ncbi:MAG: carbamoyltransferase HypF [Propionicimonas sp.]
MLTRREYLLRGVVQGVGFRPHVAVVAARHPISGFVGNDDRQVFIEAQGEPEAIDEFITEVLATLPPLATVISVSQRSLGLGAEADFSIVASRRTPGVRTLIPPDVATCPDCLADMADPSNRRFGYAFTTCTNCGPRLTIVEDLPYDRPATTMRVFEMCPACRAEYTDPTDRRYHAQPISCYDCGPQLWLEDAASDPSTSSGNRQPTQPGNSGQPNPLAEPVETHKSQTTTSSPSTSSGNGQPTPLAEPVEARDTTLAAIPDARERQAAVIAEAQRRLADGQILAVKGLGGFHLMCDARNAVAVTTLRERKRRSGKPFAVMVPDPDAAAALARLTVDQLATLAAPSRPIVIAPMAPGYDLADQVAPGLNDVGLMLPYTPLHTLLVSAGMALVATSGNLSEEPLCFTNDDARARLAHLADGFLLHNRDIHVPVEDSVSLALPGGGTLPIRRSRGHAPLPVLLPEPRSGFDKLSQQTTPTPLPEPVEGGATNPTPLPEPTSGSDKLSQQTTPTPLPEPVEGGATTPVVLAVGGELKNTFAVAIDDLAFVSAHVGDMGSLASQQAFEASVAQLLDVHRRTPDVVVCDLHPGYATTAWAERYVAAHPDVRLMAVQHHYAHALSLLAEHGVASGPVVVATVDGTGYGLDGTIWGGEVLTLGLADGSLAQWDRSWHIPTFALVGGDRSIKHPWRIAQGLAHSWNLDISNTPAAHEAPPTERLLVASQLDSGLGVVATSSAGRLFDAAAAMLGLCQDATYEAHAAMSLERAATSWLSSSEASAASGRTHGSQTTPTTTGWLRSGDAASGNPRSPAAGFETPLRGSSTSRMEEPDTPTSRAEEPATSTSRAEEPATPTGRMDEPAGSTRGREEAIASVGRGEGLNDLAGRAGSGVDGSGDDCRAVFVELLNTAELSVAERAWRFHKGLAAVFVNRLDAAATAAGTTTVGITGGVAVNRLFTTALVATLAERGYTVLTHQVVPPTDGGLSLGQAWSGRILVDEANSGRS